MGLSRVHQYILTLLLYIVLYRIKSMGTETIILIIHVYLFALL